MKLVQYNECLVISIVDSQSADYAPMCFPVFKG